MLLNLIFKICILELKQVREFLKNSLIWGKLHNFGGILLLHIWQHCVAQSYFTMPSHHVYDYSYRSSEVNGVGIGKDFSEHPVFT